LTARSDTSNKIYNTRKRYGLTKAERLKNKQEIKELFARGKRFYAHNLAIIYLPSENRVVGFVASKRIGGAVKRNRVKRVLREAYQMNKGIFKGLKVIFYAHSSLELSEVINIFRQFQGGR
jgi:ribonuclease P protein component